MEETTINELQKRLELLEGRIKTERSKVFSFRSTHDLHLKIKALAAKKGMTMTSLMTGAILRALNEEN